MTPAPCAFRPLLSLAFALAWLAGSTGVFAAPSAQLKVVTSILPIYCLTLGVAGERATIENLMAPGADAHDFQFTPRERRALDRAGLVLLNGLGMEPWLQTALARMSARPTVIEVSAGLGDIQAGAAPNPHVWLDPLLACRMVTNICNALREADPAHAQAYHAQAAATVTRLERLHEELRLRLQPFRGMAIITYHDAFAYFVRRYGLLVAGVIETVPDLEPTPGHLRQLRETVRRQRVKAIFTEPHHAGKLARQLGEDLNIPVATLDTLENGPLEADAYEAGMRRNLRVLEQTLR